MYAIIKTGGKQYRVQAGDTVKVEKLEHELGSTFDITDVLFVDGVFGEPTVKNAKVSVVVTQQNKDAKVLVFKKKRRKGYRRTRGHRQLFTELFVSGITSPNGSVKAETKPIVIDPAKKAERVAEYSAKLQASGEKPKKKEVKKKVAAAPKKKTVKKSKSGGAKKKTAKKKAAKKA
jgi:large subunit ribosomal protein L21